MAAPLYGPPPNVSVAEGLHLIFTHYCSPWKSTFAENDQHNQEYENIKTMDGPSFARMCREAPDLDKFIGRTEIDLIFSKTKPHGVRRLDYDHFLDTLLELSTRIYPDDDPVVGLANFLSRFIFALFDQPPSQFGPLVIEQILNELNLDEEELAQLEQIKLLSQQQQQPIPSTTARRNSPPPQQKRPPGTTTIIPHQQHQQQQAGLGRSIPSTNALSQSQLQAPNQATFSRSPKRN
jgi:hypothetical protein